MHTRLIFRDPLAISVSVTDRQKRQSRSDRVGQGYGRDHVVEEGSKKSWPHSLQAARTANRHRYPR